MYIVYVGKYIVYVGKLLQKIKNGVIFLCALCQPIQAYIEKVFVKMKKICSFVDTGKLYAQKVLLKLYRGLMRKVIP